MGNDRILVKSFDGLYDEEYAAGVFDINRRSALKCLLGHTWINASLDWRKVMRDQNGEERHLYVSIENRVSPDPGQRETPYPFGEPWGSGHGGIRFCRHCKQIDCIHSWESEQTYEIQHGKYYAESAVISLCGRCGLKIYRSGSRESRPNPESIRIIQDEMSKNGGRSLLNCGSGFMIELPITISEILDDQGEEKAREYVQSCLSRLSCGSAMAYVQKMGRLETL